MRRIDPKQDRVTPLYHIGGVRADRGDDSRDRDGLFPLGSLRKYLGLEVRFKTSDRVQHGYGR
jgi:hypothetical protein